MTLPYFSNSLPVSMYICSLQSCEITAIGMRAVANALLHCAKVKDLS